MPINQEHFQQTISKVIDDLWSIDPATDPTTYINSIPMQNRGIMHEYSSGKCYQMNIPSINQSIFEETKCHPFEYFVGPYEHTLFTKIVKSNKRLLFYDGGARSGKSSVLFFLKYLVKDALFRCTINDCSLHEKCGDFLRIDIRDIGSRYENLMRSLDTDSSAVDNHTKDAIREVSNTVHAVFDEYLKEYLKYIGRADEEEYKDLYCKSFEKIVLNNNNTQTSLLNCDSVSTVVADLRRRIDGEIWKTSNANDKLSQITNALQDLRPIEHLLTAQFLTISGFISNTLNKSRKLIIILDNIDTMPSEPQNRIARYLIEMLRNDLFNTLKIIIPVRLGTLRELRDEYNAAQDITESISHQSFEPSLLCFQKLNKFFIDLSSNKTYKDIGDEKLRNAIYVRLLCFWLHLTDTDKGGYAREIYNALSGTNLAMGRNVMRAWCRSADIPLQEQDSNLFINVKKDVVQAIIKAILKEQSDLTINSFRYYAKKFFTNVNNEGGILEFCKYFFNQIIDVYRDSRILCITKSQNKHEVAANFGETTILEGIDDWIKSYEKMNQIMLLKFKPKQS